MSAVKTEAAIAHLFDIDIDIESRETREMMYCMSSYNTLSIIVLRMGLSRYDGSADARRVLGVRNKYRTKLKQVYEYLLS